MPRQLHRFEPQEIAAGVDESLAITLCDENGDPLDVTGASALWKLYVAVPRNRRKPFKGDAVLEKTSPTGITLITGLATVTIGDTDLGDKSGLHWHTIQITDAAGAVSHLGQGEIMVRKTIV